MRRAAVEAAWVLADEAEAASNRAAAAHWSRWASRVTPDDEAALRRLMEMLDRLGDRSGALAEFERYRKRLLAELDLEPESETSALAAAIASAGKRGEGPFVQSHAMASAAHADGAGWQLDSSSAAPDESVAQAVPSRNRKALRRVGGAVLSLAVIVPGIMVLDGLTSSSSTDPAFGREVPSVAVLPLSGEALASEQSLAPEHPRY